MVYVPANVEMERKMSRQLEQIQEQRTARMHLSLVKAIEYDLVGAVGHTGGELRGFSVRLGEWETLVTLRAKFPAGAMIAFVGSETLMQAILKCVREAKSDKLSWKPDRFAE
jgi:hypothetical protein